MKIICIILCLFINYVQANLFGGLGQIVVEVEKLENMVSSFNAKDNRTPQQYQNIPLQQTNPYMQQNRQQYTNSINQNFIKQQIKQQPLTGIQLVTNFLLRNNIRINNIKTAGISPKGDRIAYITNDNAFERVIVTKNNSLEANYNIVGRKEVIEKIIYTYRGNDGFLKARAVNLLNNSSQGIPTIKNAKFIKITEVQSVNYVAITSYDNLNNYLVCKINLNNFNIELLPKGKLSQNVQNPFKR